MVLIREKKIKIGKYLINFVVSKVKDVKTDKALFMIPSGLESAQSAFQLQLENLPKLLPNFQIISYDPPGIGKSRPPNRREFKVDGKFDNERQQKDADLIVEGLDKLNVNKFSLLGWSYGGSVASIITSKLPQRVEKIILVTTMAFMDEKFIKKANLTREVSFWPEENKKHLIEMYGDDDFKANWSELIDFLTNIVRTTPIEKHVEVMKRIERPTLIFHGEKDFYIDDDAAKLLNDSIKNSRMIIYKGSKEFTICTRKIIENSINNSLTF